MQIYTSSWSTKLPDTILRVGISRGTPRGQPAGFRKMSELAPGSWFNSVDPAEYHRLYMAILEGLDPQATVDKLEMMAKRAEKPDVALLCYESPTKPADWCHRGQVAGWLWDKLGLKVIEHGDPIALCGWEHPKLHPSVRQTPF